jgi:hypothetical protein
MVEIVAEERELADEREEYTGIWLVEGLVL